MIRRSKDILNLEKKRPDRQGRMQGVGECSYMRHDGLFGQGGQDF